LDYGFLMSNTSSRYRECLWLKCQDASGRVWCNLCGLEVASGSAWDESHIGAPRALKGRTVGIAHRLCNREHGRKVVVPMVAKAKRQWRNHNGITGPGLGCHPLPAGRRSGVSKKISGEVIARQSQSEKHRAAMAKRYGGGE
jgi:hypothetical protein